MAVLIVNEGKIKMSGAESIYILIPDENITVTITNSDDVELIAKLLNKRSYKDTPSCPFGYAEIVVWKNSKKTSIFPATDSCHNFKIDNRYFQVSNSEWEILMETLRKYGVERVLFESGKGI
jgi:hypothetical protein